MKIALIGYGKMGRMIEQTAIERGHQIVARIDVTGPDSFDSPNFKNADVAIEFSAPAAAPDNIIKAFEAGIPVVCGTTGWNSRMPEIKDLCSIRKGALLWSSNFSIGVNIFFEINKRLAELLTPYPDYAPEIEEIHHIHKIDHPSGTAVSLAEQIIRNCPRFSNWEEYEAGAQIPRNTIPVSYKREDEVPGIHTITWDSNVDTISIRHSAKSRRGFALGAVIAAEWLVNSKNSSGWFGMDNVLK